jgi:folate-binding protein YgfZ
VGGGAYATYLTPQGRLIADMSVYRCEDHVLMDVPAAQAPDLAARLDRLIFTEDVRVADVSTSIDQIAVVGLGAAEILARASHLNDAALRSLPVRSHVTAGDWRIARTDDIELPSFDVFVAASGSDSVRQALETAGAVPISAELADALRIEAGRPEFGVDMTSDTIPLEAGLFDRAISATKGCYVGQEVIVRVLHRGGGRVAKRLVRITFDDSSSAPRSGDPLTLDGQDVGRVTSAAFSPRSGQAIALGFVKRDAAEEGTRLVSGAGTASIVGFAG